MTLIKERWEIGHFFSTWVAIAVAASTIHACLFIKSRVRLGANMDFHGPRIQPIHRKGRGGLNQDDVQHGCILDVTNSMVSLADLTLPQHTPSLW
jgi:hypothetical protein